MQKTGCLYRSTHNTEHQCMNAEEEQEAKAVAATAVVTAAAATAAPIIEKLLKEYIVFSYFHCNTLESIE